MGLAAISFNGDDSNIAGFSKGFLDSRESSPGSMTKIGLATPTGSAADSENDSDKDSVVFWAKSNSHNSSMSDTDSCRERVRVFFATKEVSIFDNFSLSEFERTGK